MTYEDLDLGLLLEGLKGGLPILVFHYSSTSIVEEFDVLFLEDPT